MGRGRADLLGRPMSRPRARRLSTIGERDEPRRRPLPIYRASSRAPGARNDRYGHSSNPSSADSGASIEPRLDVPPHSTRCRSLMVESRHVKRLRPTGPGRSSAQRTITIDEQDEPSARSLRIEPADSTAFRAENQPHGQSSKPWPAKSSEGIEPRLGVPPDSRRQRSLIVTNGRRWPSRICAP